jgi:hypothetical protein
MSLILRHSEPQPANPTAVREKNLLNETLLYVQCDDQDIHVIGSFNTLQMFRKWERR